MSDKVRKIATKMGARIVGRVPETGGGAFGAARLAELLRERLQPSQGRRPGRPTNPSWTLHPKVPMSAATFHKLEALAERASETRRKASPMQVAAQVLEEAVRKF